MWSWAVVFGVALGVALGVSLLLPTWTLPAHHRAARQPARM
ncbi:hypothetical protein [Verrucosispora sp. NA02020]|nr:hypothetical protein [Verrucosispora sp. NA02020]